MEKVVKKGLKTNDNLRAFLSVLACIKAIAQITSWLWKVVLLKSICLKSARFVWQGMKIEGNPYLKRWVNRCDGRRKVSSDRMYNVGNVRKSEPLGAW